jgi:hypothetical protein
VWYNKLYSETEELKMTTYATQAEAKAAAEFRSAEMRTYSEVIDFDGQNCEYTLDEGEVCGGWDGNDRRCECGNRRVGWSLEKLVTGAWYFYAEAY